ncbi:hypothetical protein RMATCC62417_01484 [Rhizopus microsporus]|nr:hypothetical protein RMATCC62417_01484 [Rhizopus microsporus]
MKFSNQAAAPFLFTILLCLGSVSALTLAIEPHKKECFFEYMNHDDSMSITYQVAHGGDYDIDFWLTSPQDMIMATDSHHDQGAYTITAKETGKYTFCFSNEKTSQSTKVISFNTRVHEKSTAVQTDPLKHEIEELADSIFAIKSAQEYIVARERRHRDTVESTNARVKWWSIAQLGLLITVCFLQIHYLKHFFQTKRTV